MKYDGSWIKWLEDSRVGFTDRMARKYMRIANEFKEIGTTSSVLNNLSLNKLYTLALAPEEVKEELGIGDSRIFDDLDFFTP